jgi:adenosylhomocysteine nucleosidase
VTTCVVVGMETEASIVRQACPKAIVVVGAGDAALLSSRLESALGQNAVAVDRVISVGICGALNLGLNVGDVIVGVDAVYDPSIVGCDPAWCDRLFDALQANPQPYRVAYGRFAWSATAVARLTDKAALRSSTGADVVDEETFLAGSIAAAHGLPGAALRVVCDPASFELPPAALTKLTAAGADDMGAILASVAGDIWQVPELVELAGLSATAMGVLRAALPRIGPEFAA